MFHKNSANILSDLKKYWRFDLKAGWVLSLIAFPFGLAIGEASNYSPIQGVWTGIIAMILAVFLGGSHVSAAGPAAALAGVLKANMLMLGAVALGEEADLHMRTEAGHPILCVVIFLTGVFQAILAKCKVARLSKYIPHSVLNAMMAAIGITIICGQWVKMLGFEKFESHGLGGVLSETWLRRDAIELEVFTLGMLSLGVIFLTAALRNRIQWVAKLTRILPSEVHGVFFALFTSVVLSCVGMGFESRHLVDVPTNPMDGLNPGGFFPALLMVLTTPCLWIPVLGSVILFTFIDSLELLVGMEAVDIMDREARKSDRDNRLKGRKSNPDKVLWATAITNMILAVFMLMTNIIGTIKSKVNVLAGARTLWSNFFCALFLIAYIFALAGPVSMIPDVGLSSIMIYAGLKLCSPKVWKETWNKDREGKRKARQENLQASEPFTVFVLTVIFILASNLLYGIIGGLLVHVYFEARKAWKNNRFKQTLMN